MVIRGHIKNGNGTNKYLTGSRDVRKKGFPIYLNTTYDLPLKKKKESFLFPRCFSPNYPQYGNLHRKNALGPHYPHKKVLHFRNGKKEGKYMYF